MLAQFQDFQGWDLHALWDDIKFSTTHCTQIDRIALVGEKTWEKWMAKGCKPFTAAKIREFDVANIDIAWAWLGEVDRRLRIAAVRGKTCSRSRSEEMYNVDSLTIAGIVFACTFGGALLGMLMRRALPESHFSSESKDVMKMGTGLLATLAALVLGLLVASAKSSFDAQRTGFQQLSTNLVLLDRSLKFYGPETKESRERLHHAVTLVLNHRWPERGSPTTGIDDQEISENAETLYAAIRDLSPKTDAQKAIQAQALQVSYDVARTRWFLNQGDDGSIPTPFLLILVFWLSVLFVTFGAFSPWNATVITILFICAISVTGALFLIVELDRPITGLIQISSKPLRDALGQLGR